MYHIFTIFQMRRTEAITIPLAWPSGDKHIDNGQPLHLDPDPIFSPLLKNSSHLRYFVWIDSTHVQKANRIKICILLYFTGPFPPLPFTGNQFLDFFWGVLTESLSKYKKYIPPPCFYLLHPVTWCTLLLVAPCYTIYPVLLLSLPRTLGDISIWILRESFLILYSVA